MSGFVKSISRMLFGGRTSEELAAEKQAKEAQEQQRIAQQRQLQETQVQEAEQRAALGRTRSTRRGRRLLLAAETGEAGVGKSTIG